MAEKKQRRGFTIENEREARRRLRVDDLNLTPCLRKIDANTRGGVGG